MGRHVAGGRIPAIGIAGLCLVMPARALGSATPDGHDARPVQSCVRVRTGPCEVPGGHRFRRISAGTAHTCGVTMAGAILCWGDGRSGALGDGERAIRRTPVRVDGAVAFDDVRSGDGYTCARTRTGSVFCWGSGYAVPGYPAAALRPVAVSLAEPTIGLATGRRHACAITVREAVVCWGRNIDGETGNGTYGVAASLTPVPTTVAGGLRARAVTAGLDFTCALALDGAPWCWGSNVDRVILADAPTRCGDVYPLPCAPAPARVPAGHPFLEIAAGNGHLCARTAAGDVYCWGAMPGGDAAPQTGPEAAATPRRISAAERFTALGSGGVQSCGIVASGIVYCWGRERAAAPGEPRAPDGLRRIEVPRAVAVTVGGSHACAITTTRAAYCWGEHHLGASGRR